MITGLLPRTGSASLHPLLRVPRYFALLSAIWIVAMTWKVYPQFKDALRIEGRVVTLENYLEDACGERVGPLATSCRSQTLETGWRLLAREQAKSILLIEAPLIGYVILYLPVSLLGGMLGKRRKAPLAAAEDAASRP